jgi:tRNA(fMet)-specific endonuclease VapC
MTSQYVLLDTDVLSAVIRSEPRAIARARPYLSEYGRFTFSVITRYEVMRGLLARGAARQQLAFERLCAASTVLPLTDEIVRQAATVYAHLYNRGALIGDADILIAATALTHGLALATNNQAHFRRIDELQIDNWLASEP